jgi:hypothetical protein
MGLLSFLSSCKSKFEPDKPQEQYTQTESAFTRQVSVLHIPVEIPVAELEKQINTQVNGLIYEDNSLENNGNDNFLVKVWKREAITIRADNNLFHLTVPLKIWAKGGINAQKFGIELKEFRETDFALNVHFTSKININPNWEVTTVTSPNGFDWITKPVLKVGPFEIPLSPIVSRIVDDQQASIAQEVDKQVKQKIAIKKYVQQAWVLMQNPIRVSEQYDAWLKVTPLEVLMSPLQSDNQKIRALIGIKAYTETIIGQKPTQTPNAAIPALQIVNDIPDHCAIGLTGEVSHAYATKIVSDQFLNKNFSFQNGKYNVTITSINLYGSGQNLVIKAGLMGSLNGIIYLAGKPSYNPATQVVEINTLDFTLDTKNKLIKTASWLAHGTLAKRMEEAFKVPVGNQLTEARKMIQTKLKNNQVAKGILLNGKLEELTPSDVIITPTSIVAVVLAKGKVDVKIAGL